MKQPSQGGSYRRDKTGRLRRTEAPTAPVEVRGPHAAEPVTTEGVEIVTDLHLPDANEAAASDDDGTDDTKTEETAP